MLRKILHIIYQRLWIILTLPVMTVGLSLLISLFVIEPVYEATICLYVINRVQDRQAPIVYDDVLVSQNLIKDYRELIKSKSILKSVISQLNLKDMSYADLQKNIKVKLKNDTRLIEVTVQDTSPQRVYIISNRIGETFITQIKDLMNVENVFIVENAEVPEEPVRPKPIQNAVIAFFISIIAAAGVVFYLDFMNSSVKTQKDIKEYLNLALLGSIPFCRKNHGLIHSRIPHPFQKENTIFRSMKPTGY